MRKRGNALPVSAVDVSGIVVHRQGVGGGLYARNEKEMLCLDMMRQNSRKLR